MLISTHVGNDLMVGGIILNTILLRRNLLTDMVNVITSRGELNRVE